MIHPLHDYIAGLVGKHLRDHRIVVWYDEKAELEPFVVELGGGPGFEEALPLIKVGGVEARLARYEGSFLEVRMMVESVFEPVVLEEPSDLLLVYVPGQKHDNTGSLLKELECAGEVWAPSLKGLARNLLEQRYPLPDVDEALSRDNVTYEDLAELGRGPTGDAQPSLLKGLLNDPKRPGKKHGADEMLALWLVDASFDAAIEKKGARAELLRTIVARLGLPVPEGAELTKVRALTLRYLLGNELRGDLVGVPAPASLDQVPVATNGFRAAVTEVDTRLRRDYPEAYQEIARKVQDELRLTEAKLSGDALGRIDTFPFEERVLFEHAAELVAQGEYARALTTVAERSGSFWLVRSTEVADKWRLIGSMAELGQAALSVRAEVAAMNGKPARAWVEAYARVGAGGNGWARMDEIQRRMEHEVIRFDQGLDEKALGIVRRVYEDVVHKMSAGFARALERDGWHVDGVLGHTAIWGEVLESRPKPVAYLMIDALRFEMGAELARKLEALPETEVTLRAAAGVLPGITPLGMAALLPGAAAGFAAVSTKGNKFAARIREGGAEAVMPDLAARKKYLAARVPGSVDVALDDLLGLTPSKLAKKVGGAGVVIVRSQEIDHGGETGHSVNARSAMENVLDNLVRAVRKLAAAGVEHTVITADHGHLFFPSERDESMRVDAPASSAADATVELHRRCWIGRGGATPSGCVRVGAASLGYDSDLELVFPPGSAVFKAGGDLNYHHGGLSLQEVVVPVLTTRSLRRVAVPAGEKSVQISGMPDKVTNRIVTITVTSLLGARVVALLMSEGRTVGSVFPPTDVVELAPGVNTKLAMLLTDDTVKQVTVSLRDPTTDAELCQAETIPVKLGV